MSFATYHMDHGNDSYGTRGTDFRRRPPRPYWHHEFPLPVPGGRLKIEGSRSADIG